MSKLTKIALVILVLFILNHESSAKRLNKLKSANGGIGCASCTIAVAIVEELSIVYNQTVEDSLDMLCNFLPQSAIKQACVLAVQEFEPIIINGYFQAKLKFI